MDRVFVLRVVAPEPGEIDADTADEIEAGREPTDSLTGAVDRWLGGPLDDAANLLSSWLPTGWYAKVEAFS